MAFFVFLSGAAGAGIIGIDLLGLFDRPGLLLFQIETLAGLLIIDRLPLFQLVEPFRAGGDHVLKELFRNQR